MHETKNSFPYQEGKQREGAGGGGAWGFRHEFTNNNFTFHESRNKYCIFISAKCLGYLCAVTNSLGKPLVGESKRSEVRS